MADDRQTENHKESEKKNNKSRQLFTNACECAPDSDDFYWEERITVRPKQNE